MARQQLYRSLYFQVIVAILIGVAIAQYATPGQLQGVTEFLLNVIPASAVDAFAKGDILQVLLFSILFGFALHAFGGRGSLVYEFIDKVSHVLFGMIGVIMKVAPIGAFGAMAFTIGKYGLVTLFSLGKPMACFYATCLLFIFLVLGPIARVYGFGIWRFIKYIKEELFIVLGTSSESVLRSKRWASISRWWAWLFPPATRLISAAPQFISRWLRCLSRRPPIPHWIYGIR